VRPSAQLCHSPHGGDAGGSVWAGGRVHSRCVWARQSPWWEWHRGLPAVPPVSIVEGGSGVHCKCGAPRRLV
jgi:hypothetical protein